MKNLILVGLVSVLTSCSILRPMESVKVFRQSQFHYLEKNIFLSINESKDILFLGYIDTVQYEMAYVYHSFKYIHSQDDNSLYLKFEYEPTLWSTNAQIIDKYTVVIHSLSHNEYDNDRIVYNRCSLTITKSLLNLLRGKTVYIDKCFDSSLNGYDPKSILIIPEGYQERF